MNTWPIYLKLQNEMAYGTDIAGPSLGGSSITELTLDYVHRITAQRPIRTGLVIGPGGSEEVEALLNIMSGPLFALTAHEPEVLALRKRFPDDRRFMAFVGDVHEMPLDSDQIDLLYASNVLEHAIAPYAALMQCRRVMKEGGVAIFVMPSFAGREGGQGPFHLHCLDAEVWKEVLRKCGFVLADHLVQPGGSGEGSYDHYRCIAGQPPHPHDAVLGELKTFHLTHRG